MEPLGVPYGYTTSIFVFDSMRQTLTNLIIVPGIEIPMFPVIAIQYAVPTGLDGLPDKRALVGFFVRQTKFGWNAWFASNPRRILALSAQSMDRVAEIGEPSIPTMLPGDGCRSGSTALAWSKRLSYTRSICSRPRLLTASKKVLLFSPCSGAAGSLAMLSSSRA